MPTHPITLKLEHNLYPFIYLIRGSSRSFPMRVYWFYSLISDLLIAGFGIGSTKALTSLRILQGNSDQRIEFPKAIENVFAGELTSTLCAVILVILVIVGYVLKHSDIPKKFTLLKSAECQCDIIEATFVQKLNQNKPMPDLIQSQEQLSTLVNRTIGEGALSFELTPKIKERSKLRAIELSNTFSTVWQSADEIAEQAEE